ncbi:TPA: hypothetical protein ACOEEB_004932, partial [Enterobacter asburiae]
LSKQYWYLAPLTTLLESDPVTFIVIVGLLDVVANRHHTQVVTPRDTREVIIYSRPNQNI